MQDFTGKVAVAWLTDPDHDRLRFAIAATRGHTYPTRKEESMADALTVYLVLMADAEAKPDSLPEETR